MRSTDQFSEVLLSHISLAFHNLQHVSPDTRRAGDSDGQPDLGAAWLPLHMAYPSVLCPEMALGGLSPTAWNFLPLSILMSPCCHSGATKYDFSAYKLCSHIWQPLCISIKMVPMLGDYRSLDKYSLRFLQWTYSLWLNTGEK